MIWGYMFALLVPTAWDKADDIEYTYNQSHLFSNNIPLGQVFKLLHFLGQIAPSCSQ